MSNEADGGCGPGTGGRVRRAEDLWGEGPDYSDRFVEEKRKGGSFKGIRRER